MILRLVSKNLTQAPYSLLVQKSLHLFSNKNQGDGFKNFKRKKTQIKNENKNEHRQPPAQQTIKNNSNKVEQQNDQKLNINKTAQQKFQKNQQNIIKSKKQNTNINNEAKIEKQNGFGNFKRTKNTSSEPKKQQKKREQIERQESRTNINNKQTQNAQQQSKINKSSEQPKMFSNFERAKSKKVQSKVDQSSKINNVTNSRKLQENQGKTSEQNQNQNKQQKQSKSTQQNKIKYQTQQQQTKPKQQQLDKSGFSKFKRQNKNKQTSNTIDKNNSSDINENKSTKADNIDKSATYQEGSKQKVDEVKKQVKTPQQIQREAMDKKQMQFRQKIAHFKNMKMKEQQNMRKINNFRNIQQAIAKRIYQLTGVDINAKLTPPSWVKSNPMLLYAFNVMFNVKFLIFAILAYIFFKLSQQRVQEISVQQFILKIDRGEVFRISFIREDFETQSQIGKKTRVNAVMQLKNGQMYECVSNTQFQNMVKMKVSILNSINTSMPPIIIQNGKKHNINFFGGARTLLSFLLLYLLISSLMGATKGASKKFGQGGKQTNLFQQSTSKRFQQQINIKFNDVVGIQKAKQQVVQFIDFLKSPQKYHKLGAKIPRGALLTGPPGTGKTMIAKACAGQSNVPFFTISGSQFMEMYVGVGAQRVRDLFKQAKQAAPSIIFIDQIDAVGKKRTSGLGGGNDERDNTLNQLLVQMDGFTTGQDVIVFAATNQKDVLDNALTRPGRFDRLIQVDLPDIQGRKQIFMVHLKPIVIDSQSSIQQYARRMATLTPGFSGAEIKNLCNEAAIMAARNGNKFVTIHDFQLATQRVIGGVQKKSHLITQQTRKVVAYHQCGHGVVSWFLQASNPLLKLTIIPRSKGSLGFAQYLPHESQISTKKQLQDQICVILSGRITEEVFFNRISTGAYDDLQKAYDVAKRIVSQYGMNQKLGWLSYNQSEYAKHFSKQTQKTMDQQILLIIKNCTQRARQIILQKRELIDRLAKKLLEVQTIDLTTISQILGPRPFKANKQYEQYLKQHKKMIDDGTKDKEKKKQQIVDPPVAAFKKEKLSDYLL